MRKSVLMLIMSLGIVNSACGESTINGSPDLRNQTFDHLTINGSPKFNDLTVAEELVINGSARGKHLKAKTLTVRGSFEAEDVTADTIKLAGSAELEKVVVKKSFTVGGSLEVEDVVAQDMKVKGSASLRKVILESLEANASLKGQEIKVKGQTTVAGTLEASDSNFGEIEISSKRLRLVNSKAKSIVFTNEGVLELKGNTLISGDVTFELERGKVFLYDGAKIEGKLEGAEVIRK